MSSLAIPLDCATGTLRIIFLKVTAATLPYVLILRSSPGHFKEICCSRMFGTPLTELAPIKEAVATYTSRAAEKLWAQQSLCKRLRVSIRTGMFNPDEAKYANGILVELPYPTDDTRLLTKAAQEGVERVFREGFRYSKA